MSLILSLDFNLQQYCKSATADKYKVAEQYNPPQLIVDNLQALHENLVRPIMNLLTEGQLYINSGYRCQRVNDLVNGSSSSYHLQGCAADLEYYVQGKERNDLLLEKIIGSGLKWSELIDEHNKAWIHVAWKKGQYTTKVKKL